MVAFTVNAQHLATHCIVMEPHAKVSYNYYVNNHHILHDFVCFDSLLPFYGCLCTCVSVYNMSVKRGLKL